MWPCVSTHAETLCTQAATLCTQARVAEAEARASAAEVARNESAAAIARVADLEREIAGARHEAAVALAVEAVAAPDAAAASGASMVWTLKEECREVRGGGRDGAREWAEGGVARGGGGGAGGGGRRVDVRRVRGRGEKAGTGFQCCGACVAAGDAALGVAARADLRAGAQPAAREAREG